jgi:RNA polymerase primary sigma factor
VRRALDALPERERRILELRFGFAGEPWTLEAIGHELDLTRERVRQLEGQALARLAALREFQTVAAHSATHERVEPTGGRESRSLPD